MLETNKIIQGNCLSVLKTLPDESIDLILTDPPYNISKENDNRDRSKSNSPIMRRESPLRYDFGEWDNMDREQFIDFTIKWLTECCRVLKDGGTIISFFNKEDISLLGWEAKKVGIRTRTIFTWCKCLSQNQKILCKIKDRITYTNLRDLYKSSFLRGSKIYFWSENNKWEELISMIKQKKEEGGINLYLHDGSIIKCTLNHKLKITGKFVQAKDLSVGNVLDRKNIDFLNYFINPIINYDFGWLCGLYLAEGSICRKERNQRHIQLSLNKDEILFYEKIKEICKTFYYEPYKFIKNNFLNIRIENEQIISLLSRFVNGEYSHGKYLNITEILNTNKSFAEGIVKGYLDGDGNKRTKNRESYRVGLTENKRLIETFVTLSNLLGYDIRTRKCFFKYQNGRKKGYLIDISLDNNKPHRFKKYPSEIKRIIKSSNKTYYDISLNSNHTFILPNRTISHNSNPVPSFRKVNYLSATEYLWIGSKGNKSWTFNFKMQKEMKNYMITSNSSAYQETEHPTEKPRKLINHLIEIHSNKKDLVLDCFLGSGTTAVSCVELGRKFIGIELSEKYCEIANKRLKPYLGQTKLFN